MYQILQKFDIHWHDGGPSIAMMCHLRRVSDLLYNWKSCLLCYMKDVVLHCSIFFKWNKLVRVRVRVRVHRMFGSDVLRRKLREMIFIFVIKTIVQSNLSLLTIFHSVNPANNTLEHSIYGICFEIRIFFTQSHRLEVIFSGVLFTKRQVAWRDSKLLDCMCNLYITLHLL